MFMKLHFDYHENDDGEWYWAIVADDIADDGDIIARSTDPHEFEAQCLEEIEAVIKYIKTNRRIPIQKRAKNG